MVKILPLPVLAISSLIFLSFNSLAGPRVLFDGPDTRSIDTETIDMINATESGGEILGAFYQINEITDEYRRSLSAALLNAASRGVNIHLISETEGLGGAEAVTNSLVAYSNVQHTECVGGCLYGPGSKAKMHNKIWVVKKKENSGFYVSIGSHNYGKSQQVQHQQTLIFEDDLTAYSIMRGYFNDLLANKNTQNSNYFNTQSSDDATFYFHPRKSGDTIIDVLSNIHPKKGPCEIHIAMTVWTNSRSGIASKLRDLSEAGCTVNLIIDKTKGSRAIATFNSKGSSTNHHNINIISSNDDVHGKYMLINAFYTSAQQKLTWSGSHNFSGASLTKNDETLVKTYSSSIYNDFLANWRSIPECESSLAAKQSSLKITDKQVNAPGPDKNPNYSNGEWIDFTVTGSKCINMSGWRIQDSHGNFTYLQQDTIIDAGKTLRLFSGCAGYPRADTSWDSSEGSRTHVFGAIHKTKACTGVWDNDGDTIKLLDTERNTVEQLTY